MKVLYIIAGVGVFCGSYVAGTRDWGGHAPRPQPPPGEVVAQQEPRNPPAQPRPAPAGVGIEIVNHADCDISFLVDPQYQTLAVFTYVRYRTPTLAPGDQQRFEVPPGGYQVLVDGCPRGDLIALTPDRPFFLEFVTERPGTPPLARVIAADRMVFQTALRPEPPPPVVYVCPSHPGVRFLTPCACPVCHIEVVVIRPAVVYACPVHPAVVLTGPGGCSQCSAPLVIQMEFHFGGGREEAQTDPLGPAGHTHADESGQVQHEEAPAPEQQQPPKEEPQVPPKEEPQTPPKEEPQQPPKEEPQQPPKEEPQQPPKEEPQQPPKEEPQQPPKEEPKEPPKEEPKKPPEEEPKEPPEKKPKKPPREDHKEAPHEEEEPEGVTAYA